MRPIPSALLDAAVNVTHLNPLAHGAPVHIGDPGLSLSTPLSSQYFSLTHKQTQNKHVYSDDSNMVWFVQLSWGFRIYPNLTMGNVWTCRLVMLQCSGPVEWLLLKPSSAAVSNVFDSVLFASSWNRSTGLICGFCLFAFFKIICSLCKCLSFSHD